MTHGTQTDDETELRRDGVASPPGGQNFERRWWILAVLGVAWLMVILDGSVVDIALPSAQADLGFSNVQRQWVVTGYALAFGSLLLLGGRLGDRVGHKHALVIGLVGFAIMSALGGTATGFPMLVTARALQGVFAAALTPALLALLTTTFTDPRERGQAFSIYGAIGAGGGGVGMLLGGVLTTYASWRWTLFINVFFAVAAVVGSLAWIRTDRRGRHDPLDVRGAVLATAGLFCLVFGLSQAETNGWTAPSTLILLVAGILILAVFAVNQSRSPSPLLPPRILRSRVRGGAFVAMLATNAGAFGLYLYLAYYLQETLGYSALATGLAFLPLVAAMIVASQITNRVLLARIGPKIVIPTGMALSAIGMFMLGTVTATSGYAPHILPSLIVIGLGLGLSLSPGFATGTLGLQRHEAGIGSATIQTSQQIGGAIGTALLNTLAASAASAYLQHHASTMKLASLAGYTATFRAAAILFAAGAIVVALLIPKGPLGTVALAARGEADAAPDGAEIGASE